MNINTLSNKSAQFPKTLQNTKPEVTNLYYRGALNHSGPIITIIGTRRPSQYGTVVVEQLVAELAKYNVCIVSGLAIGIDSLAHKAAIKHSLPTWAVLPSSLRDVYPARHRQLSEQIIRAGGALITEYSGSSRPNKGSFIARNRIVAGLSDLVLVIEATEKSGTMHTVNFALQMGIEVAAVPGPMTSIYSSGTNKLIKQGAHIITHPSDVAELLNLKSTQNISKTNLLPNKQLEIYKLLQIEALSFESLLNRTSNDRSSLLINLAKLEIAAHIKTLPDGTYICMR